MALSDQILGQTLRQAGTTAGQFSGMGTTDIGLAGDWFRTLLSGNRQQLQQAVSPAANAARAAADAAKREAAARGTARTGGTAAQNQQTEDELRKQIDTLIGNVRAGAADKLAGLGGMEMQVSQSAAETAGSLAQRDIQAREQAHAAMIQALLGAAGTALGGWLGRRA